MESPQQSPTFGSDALIHAIRLKLQSYLCEFVHVYEPCTIVLPYLFSLDAFDKIDSTVMLIDPVGNQLEVLVKKRKSRVYLTQGTERIGELYNLFQGGWLTFIYMSEKSMVMEVRDRLGEHVVYPTPPKSFYLGDITSPITLDDEKTAHPGDSQQLQVENVFHHSFVKTLSVAEVTNDVLGMSGGFVDHAMKRTTKQISIVDDKGKLWPCAIKWESDSPSTCNLTSGWLHFCKGHGLKAGTTICLGAAKDVGDRFYFKVLKKVG